MSKETDNRIPTKKHFLRSFLLLKMSVTSITQLIEMIEQEHKFYSEMLEEYSLRIKHHTVTRNLLEKMSLLVKEKNALCETIICSIEKMENETEKTLLTLKYIEGYTWEEVCEIMNYSLRQVYYLHNNALKHYQAD